VLVFAAMSNIEAILVAFYKKKSEEK